MIFRPEARVLLPPGLNNKPAHLAISKIDWLTGCRDAFDIEVSHLQDDKLLPWSTQVGRGKDNQTKEAPADTP